MIISIIFKIKIVHVKFNKYQINNDNNSVDHRLSINTSLLGLYWFYFTVNHTLINI